MLDTLKRAGLIWPGLIALVALGILCSLGTWQLSRKIWKDALVRQIDARLKAPPRMIEAGAIFASGAAALQPYERVRISGRFHHDKERYLFADGREGSGFHVLTPLEVAAGQIVWVNRGYVPAGLKAPERRVPGQVAGTVEVVGLVREQGERNSFTPDNDVQKNVWYWRDLPGLSRSAFPAAGTATAPIAIDAELEPKPPGGWPRGGVTLVKLPNRHLEYAGTWYGLALDVDRCFFCLCTRPAQGSSCNPELRIKYCSTLSKLIPAPFPPGYSGCWRSGQRPCDASTALNTKIEFSFSEIH